MTSTGDQTVAAGFNPDAPTSFTVSGRFDYSDRTYDQNGLTGARTDLPVRYAAVEIWEDNDLIDNLIATSKTAADGSWSALVPDNNDLSGRDIYVRIFADAAAGLVSDENGNICVYIGPVVSNWHGGNMWYDEFPLDGISRPIFPASDALNAAFNILDQVTDAARFLDSLGHDPGKAEVRYRIGGTGGSSYDHGNDDIHIYGNSRAGDRGDYDDGFDDSVIQHEFGHFAADRLSKDHSSGGNHSWDSASSPAVAWSEGWATFFSAASLSQSYYIDVNYDSTIAEYDPPLSFSTEFQGGYTLSGDDVEGAVALILWDIFDSANDAHDTVAAGADEILSIVCNPAYFSAGTGCTLFDFYRGWRELGYANLDGIREILANRDIIYWPVVGSVSDSPDPAPAPGGISLTANGVTAYTGLATVSFYRESNTAAGLQVGAGGDLLVGTDISGANGWSTTVDTAGLASGTYTYYALATDISGDRSATGTAAPFAVGTINGSAAADTPDTSGASDFEFGGVGRDAPAAVGVNAPTPGIAYSGVDGDDNFTGTMGNDTILLGAGNDAATGGGGNDSLDGGMGVDTAVYGGSRASFAIGKTSAGYTVGGGAEGTDTLTGIERLQFADSKVALDLDGAAGNSARLIGAAFGVTALANKAWVGIGLMLFDSGKSVQQVAQSIVEGEPFQQIAGSRSNAAVVTQFYKSVIGTPPPMAELNAFVGMLDGGMTQAEFLVLAANTEVNAQHIDLVGLAQTGIEFSI